MVSFKVLLPLSRAAPRTCKISVVCSGVCILQPTNFCNPLNLGALHEGMSKGRPESRKTSSTACFWWERGRPAELSYPRKS